MSMMIFVLIILERVSPPDKSFIFKNLRPALSTVML